MCKGDKYHGRRFFGIDEFYEHCIKHPECLDLLKNHVAKHRDVQFIYEGIVSRLFKKSTDIHEVPSNEMADTCKSNETTCDMMACDAMPESESAKEDDGSSSDSSDDDPWKGCTMQCVTGVSKDPFGSHLKISCRMKDEENKYSRGFFRKSDFVQQCYKNTKCLGYLKDYADQHVEWMSFYEEIEGIVLAVTTDDNSSSSSRSRSNVSSSAKKGDMPITIVKLKKSSSPDGKNRCIVDPNVCSWDKAGYTMPDGSIFRGYETSFIKKSTSSIGKQHYVCDVSHPFYLSSSKRKELDDMMLGEGSLYESLPDTSTSTSTIITKKDRHCLKEEEHLTCAVMNTAAEKLERLSPHKGTRRIIPTYVTGFDDTYTGRNDGQGQSTLVKRLNSERGGGGMKGFKKFMVLVNPTQKHWQSLLIDAENNKIYSHCSLGTIASNVEKIVGGFQDAGILNNGVSVF